MEGARCRLPGMFLLRSEPRSMWIWRPLRRSQARVWLSGLGRATGISRRRGAGLQDRLALRGRQVRQGRLVQRDRQGRLERTVPLPDRQVLRVRLGQPVQEAPWRVLQAPQGQRDLQGPTARWQALRGLQGRLGPQALPAQRQGPPVQPAPPVRPGQPEQPRLLRGQLARQGRPVLRETRARSRGRPALPDQPGQREQRGPHQPWPGRQGPRDRQARLERIAQWRVRQGRPGRLGQQVPPVRPEPPVVATAPSPLR